MPKPRKNKRRDTRTRGEINADWINIYCVIPEGPLVGQKVELREWQRAEICKIYDNEHGTRRAIVSFGRKNAKTTLAAMLLLLHLCGPEAQRNSQLFSAAQSREQAGLIFTSAAKMVRMSPALRDVIVIRETKKELVCPELGTVYRALSAEAKTAYGLSPKFIIHDELGQVRGSTSPLYEALETATGAQRNPLSVIISTQAPSNIDLLSQLIDDALAGGDPRTTISLYTAPIGDDPFSEATIRKANPAFGDFLNPDEVLGMASEAKRMPSREAEYRNLVLNQRVQVANPFISESLFVSCGGSVDDDWERTPVFGGLDLSSVNDLCALELIAKVRDRWQVKSYFWLPQEGIAHRSRRDHVPYDLWARKGFLELTPGKSIEYEYVATRVLQIIQPLNVKKIGFDRWNFSHLQPWLLRAGFSEHEIEEKFQEFGQGYQSMSPALRALESMFLTGKLAHGDHPVLKMCAGNAVIVSDPAGNRKLNKMRSHGRIDGMVALSMAAGIAETSIEAKEPSIHFI